MTGAQAAATPRHKRRHRRPARTARAALATAVNTNSALQALNDIAASQNQQVVITGQLDLLVIDDAGLTAAVPSLGGLARGLLVLALVGSLAGVSRWRGMR